MIKVIIDRKVKKGKDLSPLLLEVRAAAVHSRGYVSGETLVNARDSSNFVVVSTWASLESRKVWEDSETRVRLYKEMEPFLVGKPPGQDIRHNGYGDKHRGHHLGLTAVS